MAAWKDSTKVHYSPPPWLVTLPLNQTGVSAGIDCHSLGPRLHFSAAACAQFTMQVLRIRDSVTTAVQTELRYHSSGRFGAAAFGGFGQVAPTVGDIIKAQVLLAGGLGVRYQMTEKYPMHMRFDYSWGRDGDLFYFGVGEAF